MTGKTAHAPLHTIIDFETTQSPDGLRAVEVAIVTVGADGTVTAQSTLVDPGCRIDAFWESVHGIGDRMVRGQPRFADVWPGLSRLLDGNLVFAHNAPFDAGVLSREIQRHGAAPPRVEWLCSCRLAKRLWPDLGCHKLGHLAEVLRLPGVNSHRAEADALLTEALVRRAVEELAATVPPADLHEHLRAHARVNLVRAWPFG